MFLSLSRNTRDLELKTTWRNIKEKTIDLSVLKTMGRDLNGIIFSARISVGSQELDVRWLTVFFHFRLSFCSFFGCIHLSEFLVE